SAEGAQVLHDGLTGQAEICAPLVLGYVGVAHTDALHVRLVDDRFAPWHRGCPVVAPVELIVDDNRFGYAPRRIVDVACQVFGATAESIAEDRRAPVDPPGDGAGVRIDQQFVGIEADAFAWSVTALDAVAVELAGPNVVDVAV